MYVTEDTTRCDPEMVQRLLSTGDQLRCPFNLHCDTAGHATPVGAMSLVRFVVEEVVRPSAKKSASTGTATATASRHCQLRRRCSPARIAFTACAIASASGSATRRWIDAGQPQAEWGLPPGTSRTSPQLKHIARQYRGPPACRFRRTIRGRPKRLPHRDRRPCRRVIKPSRKMIWNWPTRSTRRALVCFRHGAGDRHRPHERQIKCAVLAGAARHCAHDNWSSASCKSKKPATTHSQRHENSRVLPAAI